ncbi:MAG: helix-turn-helix transcriptional regulator [Longicatena sp.]
MDNITGFLIRYARLQQNISQEGLCKGICVVSYLSKIEQGKVNASEEVIAPLFERLGLTYLSDQAFVENYKKTIKRFFHNYFLQEDYEAELQDIRSVADVLMGSQLVIDLHLVELYAKDCEHYTEEHVALFEKLEKFESYMNDDQLFLYYLSVDLKGNTKEAINALKKAGNIKNCSVQKLWLGQAYYFMGDNAEANVYFQQAYQLASEEGNAVCMLDSALFLGNSYSNTHDDALMRKHYKQCEMLAHSLKREDILPALHYNIGSSLLQWGRIEEAEEYLLLSVQNEADSSSLPMFLNYQKLAILYKDLENKKEMIKYLELADEEAKICKDRLLVKMHEFVHLYCADERVYDDAYLNLLIQLTKPSYKDEFGVVTIGYGYRIFHATYLFDAYQKMRRYKEALQVKESLGLYKFS